MPDDLYPYVLHSADPVPQHHAHVLLSLFLEAAQDTPWLQPNAILTAEGPKPRAGGTAKSISLINLERVNKGMLGEYVGRDATLLRMERRAGEKPVWRDRGDGGISVGDQDVRESEARKGKKRARDEEEEEVEVEEVDPEAEGGEQDPGWQDAEEFEYEQEDLVGDVGDREPEEGDEDPEPEVVEMSEGGRPQGSKKERAMDLPKKSTQKNEAKKPQKPKIDKAERKKLKKERSKKESQDVKAERKKRRKDAVQMDTPEKVGKNSSKKK
jgi:hypothetical protein